MAFQGKKRILYYVIQISSVLPLMVEACPQFKFYGDVKFESL